MSQEIEIEFKNMLTKEEFNRLKEAFSMNEFIHQENHYFDTQTFSLKNHGAALRIRKKQGSYVITLKEPAKVGLLETHQTITEETALNLIRTGHLLNGPIAERLSLLGVDKNEISYFGSLATLRAETAYQSGLLVLDHSQYLGVEDYELEFEVSDEKQGEITFHQLLNKFNIPIRPTKNKIRRFYEQKYNEMG